MTKLKIPYKQKFEDWLHEKDLEWREQILKSHPVTRLRDMPKEKQEAIREEYETRENKPS